MLKMAVFAPMPSASVRTTVSENEGFATSARQANFRLRAITRSLAALVRSI
ncbi:MAG TPA: hypothetical protein VFT47_13705 [Vicinamibacterales bacterium]|nr:hypothetical protein [Vicinamibacterales bacterium]